MPTPSYRSAARRETYEGAGGWNDGRLGQAYDLIDDVITDNPHLADDLKRLRNSIESADINLKGATA